MDSGDFPQSALNCNGASNLKEIQRVDLDNGALVRKFLESIELRAWGDVAELLHPDFYAVFPQSGEQFTREDYVRLNCEYPGEWHISIQNVLYAGDWIITEVDVSIEAKIDRAVSFFHIESSLIVELREYWPDPFPIPAWRQSWQESEHEPFKR